MSLIKKIFDAGVIGCGGAGFPTHVKLNASPEIFIVNAAECEPLLRTDRFIMVNCAKKLIEGIDIICKELSIPRGVIALKESYTKEIDALEKAIKSLNSNVTIHTMDSFYPAGDEQVVVYEVTKKIVPPAGIPLDVGAVVDNVATVLSIRDASDSIPFTEKYLTVTGEVLNPSVIKVPIGTSFMHCIELCGGTQMKSIFVVAGGPMMGKVLSIEEAQKSFVTKTTSGILVLSEDNAINNRHKLQISHMLNRAKSTCIQCTYCTQLCPRNLIGHPLKPHMIMRKMSTCTDIDEMLNDPIIQSAAICSECGVCEVYACPMGLAPRGINQLLKSKLAKAKIRYQKGCEDYHANEDRELRKPSAKRIAYRAGVGKYYSIDNHTYIEDTPKSVTIPLNMNIGALSDPIVANGENVKKGQLIAECPRDALGSNVHASIDGKITLTEGAIVITGE